MFDIFSKIIQFLSFWSIHSRGWLKLMEFSIRSIIIDISILAENVKINHYETRYKWRLICHSFSMKRNGTERNESSETRKGEDKREGKKRNDIAYRTVSPPHTSVCQPHARRKPRSRLYDPIYQRVYSFITNIVLPSRRDHASTVILRAPVFFWFAPSSKIPHTSLCQLYPTTYPQIIIPPFPF